MSLIVQEHHRCTESLLSRGFWVIAGLVIALAASPARGQNTSPVADSKDLTAIPGQVLSTTLTATDADSDPLTFIITAIPTGGTVTADGSEVTSAALPKTITNTTITFTAAEDASGDQIIQFKANDGTADSAVAKVTILVNTGPEEVDTTFFTQPNTKMTFTLPVEDFDGDALTYTITSLPGHGRLQSASTTLTDSDIPLVTTKKDVTYVPDPDYHGADEFEFTAADALVTTSTITARIEVNTTPIPDNLTLTVPPDGQITVGFQSLDADKDPVRYTILSLPAHGTLISGIVALSDAHLPHTLAAGQTTVEYAVAIGFAGTDSFHYQVKDGVSESDRAYVSVTVNTPPVAAGTSSTSIDQEGIASLTLLPIDADGDALKLRVTMLPQQGTLTIDGKTVTQTTTEYTVSAAGIEASYTADDEATGTDTFTWVANDGRDDSAPATVSIRLDPVLPEPEPEPEPEPDDTDDDFPDDLLNDEPTDDDEVLGDSPEDEPVPAPDCGTTGTAEAMAASVFLGSSLFLAPFRRRKCNATDV